MARLEGQAIEGSAILDPLAIAVSIVEITVLCHDWMATFSVSPAIQHDLVTALRYLSGVSFLLQGVSCGRLGTVVNS